MLCIFCWSRLNQIGSFSTCVITWNACKLWLLLLLLVLLSVIIVVVVISDTVVIITVVVVVVIIILCDFRSQKRAYKQSWTT